MAAVVAVEDAAGPEIAPQVSPHEAVAADAVAEEDGRGRDRAAGGRSGLAGILVEQAGLIGGRGGEAPALVAGPAVGARTGRPVEVQAFSFGSSSPGNSLTDGYFMISLRAIFQAFCTIQDSDRSWRAASSWISLSMSSGK